MRLVDAGRKPRAVAQPALAAAFSRVRAASLALSEGLEAEDLALQSMPDASPGKWHLAHTTWFFETLVLMPALAQPAYRPAWHVLFNSYYEALGPRHPRPRRGLLSRPSLDEVLAYRRDVDQRVLHALAADALAPRFLALLELGIQHEQQHQELFVTDMKHLLHANPLRPAWRRAPAAPAAALAPPECGWIARAVAGAVEIGAGADGFAFDNERPRHRAWLEPYAIAPRPVSNAEYLRFMAAGGYGDPSLWLSDGWAAVASEGWEAPLYWQREAGDWHTFTVGGLQPLAPAEPVCHLSYYEADAYARWAGARLPTEAEWESVAATRAADGAFADDGRLHPAQLNGSRFGGDVWEWTASAYLPYPGFVPLAGAAGEYNGKFMSGQMVLRGGSCATPREHLRWTYRNFFPPAARWQFSGVRLAKSLR